MKKLTTVGTALVLCLGLAAGCKKKSEDKPAAPKTEEPKGSAAPAPAPTPAPTPTPAPPPAAATGSGVPECDEYFATVEKAAACGSFAPALEGVKKGAEGVKAGFSAWPALDEAARKAAMTAAAATCKTASDGVKTTATGLGCTL